MAKELLKLEDVYLAYTVLDKPVKNNFDTSGLVREFKTTVILSKEKAKEFKKLKLNKSVKEVDTSEFKDKYKFDPPYPEQEEQYLISATTKATYRDGNLKPDWTFPRVFFETNGTRIEDPKVLIGNGSFGDVRFNQDYSEKQGNTSISIHSVLIKKHVPFEVKEDEWATGSRQISQRDPITDNPKVETKGDKVAEDLDDDLPF